MAQKLAEILNFLQQFAPLDLAEEWDNVGLLVGDENASIHRVMTCLTLTPDVAEEAIDKNVDLIVSHHPILFRSVKQLTSSTIEGKLLLRLIQNSIAVYSPHTAFDSASLGINQRLANDLGLTSVAPIRPLQKVGLPDGSGSGRHGKLHQPMQLATFLDRVREVLGIRHLQYVGDLSMEVCKIAVACGSAADFLRDAHDLGCDVLLTGEARFHACLDARNLGTALILAGHYATERPAVAQLADAITASMPDIQTWVSQVESDPIEWSLK